MVLRVYEPGEDERVVADSDEPVGVQLPAEDFAAISQMNIGGDDSVSGSLSRDEIRQLCAFIQAQRSAPLGEWKDAA